jgi:hypothetical protein
VFKYIYVYLLGLFVPAQVLSFILFLGRNPQVEEILLQVTFGVLSLVIFILPIWRFNVWRAHTPQMLRDLWENKRIALPEGNAGTSYLHFLEHYRNALVSPKRFFLSGFLMLLYGIIFAYVIVQTLSVTILVVVYLLTAFYTLGGLYCLGIMTWAMVISSRHIRKLVRGFHLSIQPFHPDQCGGLKLLGNFYFALGSPLLIVSGFLIGMFIFSLLEYSTRLDLRENSVGYLVLNVGFPLLFLLLFVFPLIVLVLVFPLQDIHRKMVREAKTNETSYFTRTEALREEIQALLKFKQIEAARAVQEEKALVETLYAPYPVWPFRVRSKISSTALEVGGSLLIGLLSAVVVEYFLPVIITLLFHTS